MASGVRCHKDGADWVAAELRATTSKPPVFLTIFPPLSGRTTKREVKVAWDSGVDPPTWSTRDATLREQRKADAARYREERTADRKRRQDGGAPEPPAPAAAAAPAPLTDKERDTFEQAVAWPEHAPLLLPFLNDSIRADVELMVAAMTGVEDIDEIWQ